MASVISVEQEAEATAGLWRGGRKSLLTALYRATPTLHPVMTLHQVRAPCYLQRQAESSTVLLKSSEPIKNIVPSARHRAAARQPHSDSPNPQLLSLLPEFPRKLQGHWSKWEHTGSDLNSFWPPLLMRSAHTMTKTDKKSFKQSLAKWKVFIYNLTTRELLGCTAKS
ncbi:hypothetical protein Celaphus_00008103 [Cervus elaphus hippelaphus]|uniref:Uncharacterized protein n=1 Tax=Cervus elaphus hippelaphus TaxID=46360 RepID=A0A212CPF3_CEREH|nr:hypothetical protein Celaphus_00008103 [Cervus elaphus hippelaphus]